MGMNDTVGFTGWADMTDHNGLTDYAGATGVTENPF